jgi:hypothetical protein
MVTNSFEKKGGLIDVNINQFTEILTEIVSSVKYPHHMSASVFQDFIFQKLVDIGILSTKEYMVENGRIDIVSIFNDYSVAIEIDRVLPKARSIIKLTNIQGTKGVKGGLFKTAMILKLPKEDNYYDKVRNLFDIFINTKTVHS